MIFVSILEHSGLDFRAPGHQKVVIPCGRGINFYGFSKLASRSIFEAQKDRFGTPFGGHLGVNWLSGTGLGGSWRSPGALALILEVSGRENS